MRIQHNIMAMSAYRNYNTNTSALAKNLEKLSSGYKINRAGDDAAGLAISEKMRAQITGLEAASKNVKDGISLVKTAEGAMQEIQDMLNRMDYLATQSANGTYQDEVDRENLNKEMEALKTEINRIADSANFNGIQLLDGSRDTAMKETVSNVPILQTAATDPTAEVGTKTVLKEPSTDVAKTSFTVELHDLTFKAVTGSTKLNVDIGDDTTLELDFSADMNGADSKTFTASDIAAKIKTAFEDTAQADGKIGGVAFTVSASNSSVTFTQTADPTSADELVDANLAVTIADAGAAGGVTGGNTTTTTGSYTAGQGSDATPTIGGSAKGVNWTDTTASSAETALGGKELTFGVNGQTFTVNFVDGSGDVAADASEVTIDVNGKSLDDVSKLVEDALNDVVAAYNTAEAAKNADYDEIGDFSLTFTNGTESSADVTVTPQTYNAPTGGGGGGTTAATSELSGTYNVETTVNTQGALPGAGQLASTKFTLTSDIVKDGNVLTIGEQKYIFKTDSSSTVKAGEGQTLIDVSGYSDSKKLDMAGELISRVDNSAFTVGYDQVNNTISIHETEGQEVYDKELQSVAEFDKLVTLTTTGPASKNGKALNLQIGDTSDSFNQMAVSIGDMHVEAMEYTDDEGNVSTIRSIDILTSDHAQKAIDVIKNAINYVSGVRGDLGAYQNRLEHTANNLSVMAENIQDAESTIRDTDIAEEMMSYTKNNILVQSAQAMLAQANAVPQGVLQLLG